MLCLCPLHLKTFEALKFRGVEVVAGDVGQTLADGNKFPCATIYFPTTMPSVSVSFKEG